MVVPRGSVSKGESKLLTVWVPCPLIHLIKEGVRLTDSDMSKFVRSAIRMKLDRLGVRGEEHSAEMRPQEAA